MWTILESTLDKSVNFTTPFQNGFIEARYVRRVPEYFICYLSSHSGCNKACRFCHLTQTGQTSFDPIGYEELGSQLYQVFNHYSKQPVARKVHFNWMARGEAIENPILWDYKIDLLLAMWARIHKLTYAHKVSTIMPIGINLDKFVEAFKDRNIDWYYSLYSLDPAFRKRWIPKGQNPHSSLQALKELQKPVTLHWAFIQGENDSLDQVEDVLKYLDKIRFTPAFNLVRYNPFDSKSQETQETNLNKLFETIKAFLSDSKIIPRVGYDVKASCGMFINNV